MSVSAGRAVPAGAGQFGSRWVATTPRRKKSGQYMTRAAAAGWLVAQARARQSES